MTKRQLQADNERLRKQLIQNYLDMSYVIKLLSPKVNAETPVSS